MENLAKTAKKLSPDMVQLKKHIAKIYKTKTTIRCRQCNETLLPKEFENHAVRYHALPRNSCAWCFGKFKYPSKQRGRHVSHLNSCFDTYFHSYCIRKRYRRSPSPPPAPAPECSPPPTKKLSPYGFYDPVTNTTTNPCINGSVVTLTLPTDIEPFQCDSSRPLPDRFYFEYKPKYPECDLFGVKKFTDVSPGIYEMQFTLDLSREECRTYDWWHKLATQIQNRLTFRGNDDIGIYYILMYILMKATYPESDMWHVFVRFPGYESFEEQMNAYGDEAFVLPFSCLCKGGGGSGRKRSGNRYEVYWHHKHMIVVARNMEDFKKNCWQKIRSTLNAPPGVKQYKCKGIKPIQNYFHLMFAIRYLGKPQSRCFFDKLDHELEREEEIEFVPISLIDNSDIVPLEPAPSDSRVERQMNHYYIHKSMSHHFVLAACSQVKGSWERLLNVMCGQKSVEYIVENCDHVYDRHRNLSFKVKIKYALENNPLQMHVVLHVDKEWVPYKMEQNTVEAMTEACIFRMGDEKLYFKRYPSALTLSESDWYWMQAERGNLMFQTIREAYWRPTKNQQWALNGMIEYVNRWRMSERMHQETKQEKKECEKENVELKRLIEERDQTTGKQNQVNENLEQSIRDLDNENAELRKMIQDRDKKVVELEKRMKKINKDERQNTEMHTLLMEQHQTEIEQLKKEIERLKKEMKRILAEKRTDLEQQQSSTRKGPTINVNVNFGSPSRQDVGD